ncbi:MAG: exodeoxyribonuclease I [Bacteroidota bacterium]|nr:exodeoxyribonuclease I [Bacteroidota bacterium]
MEFVWYDYETWGRFARFHRPCQVAAIRTDAELERIGPELLKYCRPREDCLISPGAVGVNRKTPQEVTRQGVSEAEFAKRIHLELTRRPNTCIIGYNAMTFDHEVTRQLFYRNLRDPYEWHWVDGNARMDLIFLVCAVRLLHPGALRDWPDKNDGCPSFKLEDLVRCNLEKPDQMAHEALADTRNMLDLARLIKRGSPTLFDHALRMVRKHNVEAECEDHFLYVSPFIPQKGRFATILTRIGRFNRMSWFWSYDLSGDPTPLQKPFASWSKEDLKYARRFIRRIKTNDAPFVRRCPLPARTQKAEFVLERMQLPGAQVEANLEQLKSGMEPIYEFCAAREEEWLKRDEKPVDADDALYSGGFWSDKQRGQMEEVIAAGGERDLWCHKFDDVRLESLVFRYRARNFPNSLTSAEQDRWRAYCRSRQLMVDGRFNPAKYWDKELAELREDPANTELIGSLEDWRAHLRDELSLDCIDSSD